jgi:V/A-type H+-transporting ATPase subunit A
MLKLGMPVQELLRMPLLAKARRWKIAFGSDELDALKQEAQEIVPIFDALRAEYASPAAQKIQAVEANQ